MVSISTVVTILQFIVLGTVILLTLVYSISLIIFQGFRHHLHIFTINVCVGILCCSIYWLINYVMLSINAAQFYNIKTCSLVYYAQTMCTLQLVLALVVTSINRLCCILYYNRIFLKSKKWTLICVVCQWLVGIVISLPAFIRNEPICTLSPWMRYYTLVVTMVMPISLCLIMNIIIFKYVQSSTRRIRPVTRAISITHHNHHQQPTLSRRDIHLLRHMIIMFLVFVIGWCPIYITSAIAIQIPVTTLTLRILSLLAELSLLCDIIDLYLYSHGLRKHLLRLCMPCNCK